MTIAMDLNTFLGPWKVELPIWKFLDGTAHADIIAELSSINKALKNNKISSIQESGDVIEAEICQAVAAGESVDFEQLIAIVEKNEWEYGKFREQIMTSFKTIARQVTRKFPEMPNQVLEIGADAASTLDKAIEEFRGLRFRLMALEAQLEDDSSGIILKSPEDIRDFFLGFS